MASEIRVDKITSLSGVGTITPSSSGIDISGITTVATLKATTGIVTTLTATTGIVTTLTTNTLTANSTTKVGSGVTLSPDGDVFATGVTTSTTFVGNLTGAVTGTASGNAVLTGSTNNQVVTVTGSNAITGESGLTYDGNNLNISVGAHDSGMALTAANNNQETQLNITGKASDGTSHEFKINVKRSANRLDIVGGGSARFSILSDGKIGVNNTAPQSELQVGGGTNPMSAKPTLHVAPSSGNAAMSLRGGSPSIYFDGTSGGHTRFLTDATDIAISNGNLDAAGSERFRFRTDGGLCFNGDTAAANALDDYEEGSFTPDLEYSGSTYTFSYQEGKYVKIGRLVYIQLFVYGHRSGGSATIRLSGLPFTIREGDMTQLLSQDIGLSSYPTNFTYLSGYGMSNQTKFVLFYKTTSGSAANLEYNRWSTNSSSPSYIYANATYFTDT